MAKLGTAAFAVGTAAWLWESWRDRHVVDAAAVLFGIGTLALAAGRPLAASSVFGIGTIVWGLSTYRDKHVVDGAAALYFLGCIGFVVEALAGTARKRARIARRAGSIAFVLGTAWWARGTGFTIPVVSYGVGCLLFSFDAFQKEVSP